MTIRTMVAAVLLAGVVAGCGRTTQTERATESGTRDTSAADTTPSGHAFDPADSTIHILGYGPVLAGMTLAQAAAALGESLVVLGPRMEPCYYVTAPGRPGVAFMIIDGRIARVDVQPQGRSTTVEGVGVGDTEERVHAVYGARIEVQPHKYVDGHYLIVRPAAAADSNYRMIFDTDGKRVTSFRAGRMPEVRWVEGCS